MQPERQRRPSPLSRALIFAGLRGASARGTSRSCSRRRLGGDLVLPALLARRRRASRRPAVAAFSPSQRCSGSSRSAALVGRAWPSRAHPLAPISESIDLVHDGVARFATVTLPFDPVAEPGLHALLLAGFAVWCLALALVWLVAARPLPTVVLGVLPVALASSEFPLGRPGVRVALLAALVVWTLGAGRRTGPRPIAAFALPLVVVALVGAGLPGLARASFLDWHAWGSDRGDSSGAATDVQYAWDQSYDGLHFTGEPVVVLRVRSPRPAYWRVTVLDSFDGLRFEERAPGTVTAPPGAEARVEPRPPGAASDAADRDRRPRRAVPGRRGQPGVVPGARLDRWRHARRERGPARPACTVARDDLPRHRPCSPTRRAHGCATHRRACR